VMSRISCHETELPYALSSSGHTKGSATHV